MDNISLFNRWFPFRVPHFPFFWRDIFRPVPVHVLAAKFVRNTSVEPQLPRIVHLDTLKNETGQLVDGMHTKNMCPHEKTHLSVLEWILSQMLVKAWRRQALRHAILPLILGHRRAHRPLAFLRLGGEIRRHASLHCRAGGERLRSAEQQKTEHS